RRDALVSAEHDPTAIRASIRTFGNGGLFSVSGWFANRALGAYRAYLTNTADTVVLRFRDGVVVVSPDAPRDFVAALDPTG
ncbi:MAG: hypothetical protein KC656_33030, partial [Myxococcales bacterium]|nr:hypothetical protein [Myxococcales bacterium]